MKGIYKKVYIWTVCLLLVLQAASPGMLVYAAEQTGESSTAEEAEGNTEPVSQEEPETDHKQEPEEPEKREETESGEAEAGKTEETKAPGNQAEPGQQEEPGNQAETGADQDPAGDPETGDQEELPEQEGTEDTGAAIPEGEPDHTISGNDLSAEETEETEEAMETEALQAFQIDFYTMEEDGSYSLLETRETDEQGRVSFPEAPGLSGYRFEGWETEDFQPVTEESAFDADTGLYAVWELAEEASDRVRTSIGISQTDPKPGQSNVYSCTNGAQTWTVPAYGNYKITCSGGAGGSMNFPASKDNGGRGSRISGEIELKKGEVLYVHVGGNGSSGNRQSHGSPVGNPGGYNGGADSGYDEGDLGSKGRYWTHGAGGGASDVRYQGNGVGNQIIVAGGGGGANKNTDGASADGGSYNGNRLNGSGESGGGGYYGGTAHRGGSSYIHASYFKNTSLSAGGSTNGQVTIQVVSVYPSLSLAADVTDWTKEDVTLTATVLSEGGGLETDCYCWETDEEGNALWTSENTCSVSQNGTYHCTIRDKKGKQSTQEIQITNIDKLQPDTEIQPDTTDWTRDAVLLTVSGDDAEETAAYGKSGLPADRYSWEQDADGNDIWTDAAAYTASQNGTYRCKAKDNAGNITEIEYAVWNIDRTAPEIFYERPEEWYEGGTTLTWKARDLQPDGTGGSGLAAKAYSLDGTTFSEVCEQEIPGEGSYQIWVRDQVGNVAEQTATLHYDKRPSGGGGTDAPPPIPPALPEIPEIPPAESGEGSAPVILPFVPQKEPEMVLPALAEPVEPIPIVPEITPKIQKVVHEEPEEQITTVEKNMTGKNGSIPYMVGGTLTASTMFAFLVACMSPIAKIYEVTATGTDRKIGWKIIGFGKQKINLTKYFENTSGTDLKIKYSYWYARQHKNKDIVYIKQNGEEIRNIEREVTITR